MALTLRRAALFGAILTATAAMGACAPSIPRLVAERHYREALCAIGRGAAEDDRLIRRAIRGDLGAEVQVTTEEVPLGEAPPDRKDEPSTVLIARVHVATNALPLDRMSASVDGSADSVTVANLESLAAIMHEEIPRSHQEGPNAVEGVVFGILAVATLGLLQIEPSGSRTVYPTEEEIHRAAPRASALAPHLQSSCSRPAAEGVAVRCTYSFIVRRDARAPVSFTLSFSLESHPERGDACVTTETATLVLGTPDVLASQVAQIYPTFRHLEDVALPNP